MNDVICVEFLWRTFSLPWILFVNLFLISKHSCGNVANDSIRHELSREKWSFLVSARKASLRLRWMRQRPSYIEPNRFGVCQSRKSIFRVSTPFRNHVKLCIRKSLATTRKQLIRMHVSFNEPFDPQMRWKFQIHFPSYHPSNPNFRTYVARLSRVARWRNVESF